MRKVSTVLIAAIAVAGLVLFLVVRAADDRTAETRVAGQSIATTEDPSADSDRDDLIGAESRDERQPVARQTEVDADSAQASRGDDPGAPDRTYRTVRAFGTVDDVAGKGIANVAVRAEEPGGRSDERPSGVVVAHTDGLGGFVADVRAPCVLTVREAGLTTLADSRVTVQDAADPHVIVACESAPVSGTVVDESGAPIARALAEVLLTEEATQRIEVRDSSLVRWWETQTAEDGSFRIPAAPVPPGAELHVSAEGYRSHQRPIHAGRSTDLRIELRPTSAERELVGCVLLPDGRPAEGARVLFAGAHALTGVDGSFELATPPAGGIGAGARLIAVMPGFQPLIRESFGEFVLRHSPNVPFVRLVLPSTELAIEGVVVAPHLGSVEGWRVCVYDPTETYLAGMPTSVEALAGGGSGIVYTGPDGGFVIPGLRPREYVVQAWHPESLLTVRSKPVPAGASDVKLIVPESGTHSILRGRVHDSSGRGVPDARVVVSLVLTEVEAEGWQFDTPWRTGASTRTDSRGDFFLEDVPKRFVQLHVFGDSIMPTIVPIDSIDAGRDPILVRASRRRRMQLVSDREMRAAFVKNGTGKRLDVFVFAMNQWQRFQYIPVQGERSRAVSVSEEAETVVVELASGSEVEVRPDFVDDGITTVEIP